MIIKDKDQMELERVLALLLVGITVIRRDGVSEADKEGVSKGLLQILGMTIQLTGCDVQSVIAKADEIHMRRSKDGEGE